MRDFEPDNLLNLIIKIEPRPALFVGNTDLLCLYQFLSGYCFSKQEENEAYGNWLSVGFREFLAEKYNDKRSFNWASLLIENEDDGKSTDAFFRLLHKYLAD